jgi:hypothetical protein
MRAIGYTALFVIIVAVLIGVVEGTQWLMKASGWNCMVAKAGQEAGWHDGRNNDVWCKKSWKSRRAG